MVTREAEGEAAIVGGNVDRAAREAREAALRSAVEQVAGVIVSSQSLAVNSQLVSDQVYAHSAGYVRSYEVLSQTTERNVVKVKVRAQVGTAELDRDLQAVQALVRRLQGRKLVILIQEQTIDEKGVTSTSGVTATVLTDAFKRDGWTVIDPSFAAGKVRVSSAVALGATEAKEIGTLSKADFILYGTVGFRDVPADGILVQQGVPRSAFPLTGDYDLGVFETSAGAQLAKVSGKLRSEMSNTSVNSREESAYNLVRANQGEIVGAVRKAVLESLRASEQNGARIVVEVQNAGDFATLQAFRQQLSVWSAAVREVGSPSLTSGTGKLEVTYLGTAERLAEQIDGKSVGQAEGLGHRRLGQRARGEAGQVMRAALLALALSTTALGAVGTVTVVDGPAFRTPKGGAEQPLQQGASVELDDTLRTGPAGGLKVTLTDQSVVVLGPDSELLVERAEFEGQERSRVSLKLLVGGIWAKVKKAIAGTDSTFEVSAARAVAGVRGTIFRVDATPLIAGTHPPKIRETVVRVSEGRVGGERTGEGVRRRSRLRRGPGSRCRGPPR